VLEFMKYLFNEYLFVPSFIRVQFHVFVILEVNIGDSYIIVVEGKSPAIKRTTSLLYSVKTKLLFFPSRIAVCKKLITT
jgi:hypothetical protein